MRFFDGWIDDLSYQKFKLQNAKTLIPSLGVILWNALQN
jgi:hypothetical protein